MLTSYNDVFSPENSYFLTLKGPDAKHQKIGYVNDLLRKVSSTYLVVREKNKISDGYHFHAIAKMEKKPPATWYKKGVHMKLQKIGSPEKLPEDWKIPIPYLSRRTLSDMREHYEDNVIIDYLMEKTARVSLAKMRKNTQIEKVLRYMSKDLDMPMQYTDYIYVHNKKHVKIHGG